MYGAQSHEPFASAQQTCNCSNFAPHLRRIFLYLLRWRQGTVAPLAGRFASVLSCVLMPVRQCFSLSNCRVCAAFETSETCSDQKCQNLILTNYRERGWLWRQIRAFDWQCARTAPPIVRTFCWYRHISHENNWIAVKGSEIMRRAAFLLGAVACAATRPTALSRATKQPHPSTTPRETFSKL